MTLLPPSTSCLRTIRNLILIELPKINFNSWPVIVKMSKETTEPEPTQVSPTCEAAFLSLPSLQSSTSQKASMEHFKEAILKEQASPGDGSLVESKPLEWPIRDFVLACSIIKSFEGLEGLIVVLNREGSTRQDGLRKREQKISVILFLWI